MKLQEILTEEVVAPDQYPLIFQQIQSECSDYLQAVYQAGDQYLYRGVNYRITYFTDQSNPGRKPKDSSLETTILFDQAMTQAGFAAQRRNSKFTTGDLDLAERYTGSYSEGEVYVVFPVNGFQFSWSQKHKDMILDDQPKWVMDGRTQMFDQMARNLPEMNKWKIRPNLHRLRADWLEHWGDRQDLEHWLIHDIKIPSAMLAKSAEYHTILGYLYGDAEDWSIIDLPAWHRKFQMTDRDLPSAIRSGNEVLIQGKFHAIQNNCAMWRNWVDFHKN